MSLVNAHPDTLEPGMAWLKAAACTGAHDAMFPGSSATEIEDAKALCRRCPVLQECLKWALDTRQEYGVWGGMSEEERFRLRRSVTRRQLTPEVVAKKADEARQPPKPPRTMRQIFDDNTTRLYGGHLAWTGPKKVSFRGKSYTPKQLAFTLDRGHWPNGRVASDCDVTACVLPRHLADTEERNRTSKAVV